MGNTLEFSVLFVCLSFSVPPGTEKIAGLWFARVVSTQAGTVVYIYIYWFSYCEGWGKAPPTSWKFAYFPTPGKLPPVDPLPPNFYPPSLPHQRLIPPSSPLNNNFHVITQWKPHFSCSHCSCTIFVLISCSLYTQVMLILILNEAVFSFEKGSNGQNHSCSFSHHPVKKFSLLVKYMISCPSGGMPTYPLTPPPLLALFGKPWYIKWSLLAHWYQQWVTVRHVPKCMSWHKAILVINRSKHILLKMAILHYYT